MPLPRNSGSFLQWPWYYAGAHSALSATRKMILERAGHQVVPALAISEIVDACRENAFDVAVLGQGLAPNEKQHAFSVIREHCPSARVLELYRTFSTPILREADDWLEVPLDIPPQLAERVTRLAEKVALRRCWIRLPK